MKNKIILRLFLLLMSFVTTASVAADLKPAPCDMDAYMKVIASCFTGRVDGFGLPKNELFAPWPGPFTESWDLGAYDSSYKGEPFQPSGPKMDPTVSVMPPYMWGAVGQICDPDFNPETHPQCVSTMKKILASPILNAQYAKNEFYWRAHGHNCHDAVEDVGMCLLNATKHMTAACGFEAKAIVWDAEPDIKKALGNVYHSQLLIKRMHQLNPTTQEPVVCLAESQAANPSGIFDEDCCTTNLDLFEHGSIEEYNHAFARCPIMYSRVNGIFPHLYEIASFREMRQTGTMDVPSSYNRERGVIALTQNKIPSLGGPFSSPKVLRIVYDKKGIPLAINVR